MSVERLGRFELVSHLASGGMAKVFLARVAGLAGFERHVVLKTLRKEDIPDESYVGMFLDEARLAASLHHQHVAQVYDVGCTSDGTYFLAMEYIHGKTVRSVLESVEDRRLWMPLDFGLSVVAAAAAGLHHAHERCRSDGTPLHIVHRDVSPSNVLVSYDGSIKLIDFGIAKATARVTQTRTGFIKGKAGYMAPEQARGYAVDRRSDVFSLGVLAYELTTQHRAFDAPTEFERVEKIVHGDIVPPSHWVPDYPAELEEIVLTSLSLDPDDRYETADEMRAAIESVAKSENLILGGAPIARLLAMLYGHPLEPWIAPPRSVAQGSGSHDSLVFVPDLLPEPIDESSDITKPIDRELTEAEAIADELAERHAAAKRHVAARDAAAADADARSTLSMRGSRESRSQLPRAGTIKPSSPSPDSEPSAPQIVITESSSAPRDLLSSRAPSPASDAPSSRAPSPMSEVPSMPTTREPALVSRHATSGESSSRRGEGEPSSSPHSASREPSSSPRSASREPSSSPRSASREPSSSPRNAAPMLPPPLPPVSRSMTMASSPPPLSRSAPVTPPPPISRSMPATQPPPIPSGALSRSMPAVSSDEPPPIPAGTLSRSMPAVSSDEPPPIPAGTLSRSMPAVSADDPPSFIAQPIAPVEAPLTLDDSASVPLLIAVDTPSTPISNYLAPMTLPPPVVPPVTIQPRNRKTKAPAPSGTARASTATKLRRQLLAVIACGAVLGLAIGVTITILGNDDAPATKHAIVTSGVDAKSAIATKAGDAKSAIATTAVGTNTAITTKAVDASSVDATSAIDTKLADAKSVDATSAIDTKPADAKVVDAKSVDTKSAIDTKRADAKAVDTNSDDTNSDDTKLVDATSAKKPADAKLATAPSITTPTTPPPATAPVPSMATVPVGTPDITESTPSPIAEARPAATEVTISVTTDPPGATVVLDGVRLGTTPYTGSVPAQKRDGWLKVRKRNHIAIKTKVDRATDIRWDVKLDTAKR